MGAMRPWHWIVVLLVVLLIFGGNKLPELAGSVGKSMKVFKKEVKELQDDDASSAQQPQAQIQQPQAQIQQPQQGTYYTQPTQPGQTAPQTDGTVQQ